MNHLKLPFKLLNDNNLCLPEKVLYAHILQEALEKDGFITRTNENLMELMGVADKSLKNYIRRLADKGYIKRETERKGFTPIRKIYPLKQF
jgi:Mn-dependent DtxR family transcriptional regulator